MSLDNHRPPNTSDRITISLKRPSSNPPAGPVDLIAEEAEKNGVSAFVVLPDGTKNSLGIFTPETTIAELIRYAKRTDR